MRLTTLIKNACACTTCEANLPLGPRPLFQVSATARLIIIGQAPGAKTHERGTPWDDASGKRLRNWLGLRDERFYDAGKVALMPMGFCYPGKGAGGDLPPRPECAPQWHGPLLNAMPDLKLTIYIGKYALDYYLDGAYKTITDAAGAYDELLPKAIALPHPSPRNNRWLTKNPWFEQDVLPKLRRRVRAVMG